MSTNATNLLNAATFGTTAAPIITTFAGNGQLVSNDDSLFYNSGTIHWSPTSTNGWTLGLYQYAHAAGNTTPATLSNAGLSIAPIVGQKYRVYIQLSSITAGGTLTVAFGGASGSAHTLPVSTRIFSICDVLTAVSQAPLTLTPSSAFAGVIQYVLVNQVALTCNGDLAIGDGSNIHLGNSATTITSILTNYGVQPMFRLTVSGNPDAGTGTSYLQSSQPRFNISRNYNTTLDTVDILSDALSITSNVAAKVGINQVAGTEALEITGNSKASSYISTAGASGATHFFLYGSGPSIPRYKIILDGADPNDTTNTGSNFQLKSYSDGGALIQTSLHVKRANGYVGINNTAPSEQLDVSGNIKCSGSFIPVIGSATVTNGAKLNINDYNIKYSKFGNMLFLYGYFTWNSNSSTGSGDYPYVVIGGWGTTFAFNKCAATCTSTACDGLEFAGATNLVYINKNTASLANGSALGGSGTVWFTTVVGVN